MNVLRWCYWHHLPSAGFAAKEVAKVLFSTSYPSFVRPLGLKIFDCQFCNRRPLDRIGFAGLRFPPKLHWNFVLKKVSRVPIIGFHWHFNKYFPPETIPWLDKYETVVVRGGAVSHVSPLQAYRVVGAIERNSNFLSILYARIFFSILTGELFLWLVCRPFSGQYQPTGPILGLKIGLPPPLEYFQIQGPGFTTKLFSCIMCHVYHNLMWIFLHHIVVLCQPEKGHWVVRLIHSNGCQSAEWWGCSSKVSPPAPN